MTWSSLFGYSLRTPFKASRAKPDAICRVSFMFSCSIYGTRKAKAAPLPHGIGMRLWAAESPGVRADQSALTVGRLPVYFQVTGTLFPFVPHFKAVGSRGQFHRSCCSTTA